MWTPVPWCWVVWSRGSRQVGGAPGALCRRVVFLHGHGPGPLADAGRLLQAGSMLLCCEDLPREEKAFPTG